MSAPIRLDSGQLRRLADFLDASSAARVATGISLTPYAPPHVELDGNAFQISWNDAASRYEVDDRIGS